MLLLKFIASNIYINDFPLRHQVKTNPVVHTAFCLMDNGGKAAEV
jgi:hypothetical protein